MKELDFNAIWKEIKENEICLLDGTIEVYEFTSIISEKYFKPVDKYWSERTGENPYLDVLFGMLEIKGIELD